MALQGYNTRGPSSIQGTPSLCTTLGDPSHVAVAELYILLGIGIVTSVLMGMEVVRC